ncbi:MAG: 3-hydroxyacyl-ACP dehydratase FabZ [Candidatus Omnitrophica bacterium]|nr:3-hydroxyacyl-ACP dehydratase FabZ [Candidatus Omnitrophota bacterium]
MPKIIDIKQIMEKLPHRYPFILVDRVLDYEEGKWIKALKNVTMNEPFFQGHFPGEPIMPGVLQVEAMAQAGGILAMLEGADSEKLAFFMTIDKCKFRKPVVPGDQVIFEVEVTANRRGIVQTHAKASVDGEVVSEADLKCAIVDKDKA